MVVKEVKIIPLHYHCQRAATALTMQSEFSAEWEPQCHGPAITHHHGLHSDSALLQASNHRSSTTIAHQSRSLCCLPRAFAMSTSSVTTPRSKALQTARTIFDDKDLTSNGIENSIAPSSKLELYSYVSRCSVTPATRLSLELDVNPWH